MTERIDTYIQNSFQQQLATAIKARFGDREVMELSVGTAVASKISDWLKTVGFLVGIPIALMTAYLGFLGWDTKNTIGRTKEEIQSVNKDADSAQKTLETALSQIKSKQDQMADLDKNINSLRTQIAQSQSQLAQVGQLRERVESLEVRFQDSFSRGGDLSLRSALSRGQAIGVDVSHLNNSTDWHGLHSAGVAFVFIRATQGVDIADRQFQENMAKAKEAGLLRGAYHFFDGSDASQQAANFLSLWNTSHGELPPEVDFEESPSGPSGTLVGLISFLKIVEGKTGCRSIVYGGSYLRQLTTSDPALGKNLSVYPLHLAEYTQTPQPPKPWQNWTFWQVSDGVKINGMGALDTNIFHGSPDELKAFAVSSCRAH